MPYCPPPPNPDKNDIKICSAISDLRFSGKDQPPPVMP